MEIKAGQIWQNKRTGVEYEIKEVVIMQPISRMFETTFGECVVEDLNNGEVGSMGFGQLDRGYEFVRNSGEPSREDEKGIKSDSNKRRYSLLPNGAVNEVVDVLEFGSQKYSDNNWQHVNNARTRYYDAALRHIDAWWQGQINDDETGKHHLAHAVCCLLFLMYFDMSATDE